MISELANSTAKEQRYPDIKTRDFIVTRRPHMVNGSPASAACSVEEGATANA